MENESTITDDTPVTTATSPAPAASPNDATTEIADEQLIEEISIDGMCGVY